MKFLPDIKFANLKKMFQSGKYVIVLLGNFIAADSVKYRYIMAVLDEARLPCFIVSSEVNSLARIRGGGSHFLCIFDGEGHLNFGGSDDWGDEAKFVAEAMRIVREKFVPDADPPPAYQPKMDKACFQAAKVSAWSARSS